MNSTLTDTTHSDTQPAAFHQAVVATYSTHDAAETAVRRLSEGGVPVNLVSIIGRHYQTREDIQGFYRPADAALVGAGQGAWFGGFFGLMAGAIGGAGIGALVNGLIAAGVPPDQAIKYQDRLQAGEFLIVVHGGADETRRAYQILEGTTHTHLQAHLTTQTDAEGHLLPRTRL